MSDDARPAGETVAVLLGQIRAQVCCCEDAAECGTLEQISAARAEMDRLLDGYREQVAAEARAALLADAPVVWVATDETPRCFGGLSHHGSVLFGRLPKQDDDGDWDAQSHYIPLGIMLTPPGTVRRAYLVIEEETHD